MAHAQRPTQNKYPVSIGDKFNDWEVIAPSIPCETRGPKRWPCRCVCGREVEVNHFNLVTGRSMGCGCGKDKKTAIRNETHGLTHTRAYKAWCSMWVRCTNEKADCYEVYQHRRPPEEWRDFMVFYAEMGGCPEGLSLDRIDNDRPYGPGNCRWVSMHEQAQNKSNTVRVLLDGKVVSLKAACRTLGIIYTTAAQRVREQGWSVARALNNRGSEFTGETYG